VIVDISGQRAYVFIDNRLAFETPISSASRGRHTPRGTFTITEKIRSGKRSTIYKSLMPYWMRLDQSAIGMHTGQLPGYPASHGCMRMPDESAKFVFDLVPKGTIVQVVDSLKPAVVEPAPAVLATR
jgi:lipoprotein-anchoring transpeptidase ErfK/SrfK